MESVGEVQTEGTLQPAHRRLPQRRELAEEGDEGQQRDAHHPEHDLLQQVHADMIDLSERLRADIEQSYASACISIGQCGDEWGVTGRDMHD